MIHKGPWQIKGSLNLQKVLHYWFSENWWGQCSGTVVKLLLATPVSYMGTIHNPGSCSYLKSKPVDEGSIGYFFL